MSTVDEFRIVHRPRRLANGVWRCSLLVLAAAAGCTVGPDYRPPEDRLPERWSGSDCGITTTRPAEVARWWTVFGDPTLNRLIERAVRSNLDLRMAAARLREARAQRAIAAADRWPQVGMAGSIAYEGESPNRRRDKGTDSRGRRFRDTVVQETAKSVVGGSLDPSSLVQDVAGEMLSDALTQRRERQRPRDQGLFEFGFDASWELDVFGGIRRSVEAAEAEADAAGDDYRDVLVILLAEVARNYAEARGFQQQLVIARNNIETQQESLRLARSLCDAGVGDELDVAQAQAQLASTQSRVSVLETSFRHSVHWLSLLLAELPDATLAELADEAPFPSAPLEIPLGLPSDLLRRRPDIRRSERLLAAATARVGIATAELFPKFSLDGSLGLQSFDVRRLLDGRSLFWSVGPGVNWPILDGGRIRADIEVQDALRQQALAQYEFAVLNAVKEVEDALVSYQNEHVRYRHLADAVDANRRAVSLARAQYNEGVADFLVVLDSQRSLYAAQAELVESRTNTTLHAIAVFKALGGGWALPVSSPGAPATMRSPATAAEDASTTPSDIRGDGGAHSPAGTTSPRRYNKTSIRR